MSKKTHSVSVRFDQDVKDALDDRARDEDRSISWLVNRICREHFKLDAPTPKAAKR